MFVAASSECFPKLSLDGALQKLVDLEYTSVEIALHDLATSSSRPRSMPIWKKRLPPAAKPIA